MGRCCDSGLLASTGSVTVDLAVLAMAITIGLAIGAIRFRSLKLGISGVLFASLLFGQMGFAIDSKAMDFLRNFALIVFMYTIGLQVGPGLGASLRSAGLRLNLLALVVILLGGVMALALSPFLRGGTAPGLYCGAFNTTAGLAAVQETVRGMPPTDDGNQLADRNGLAYSITYPFGVVGPMLVIVALRALFGVQLESERAALAQAEERLAPHIETADIEVTQLEYAGI